MSETARRRFRIVPQRSRCWIDARSNVHPIHNECDGLEGFVELGVGPDGTLRPGDAPAGRVALAVDRLRSGNPLEDRELRRRIDARHHPTIDGVLVGMQPIGDATTGRVDTYTVEGDVTFRGVTRRCADAMRIRAVDDRTITLEGRSTFDIRDFGMDPPRVLMLRVAPDVTVRVEIVAEREG